MAYPDRGVAKAAMGHYLTESARIALEAMEPEEGVVELGPGKQMPVVGPNQLLDMPLFSKTPFLPGSNTLFYTTKVGERLYQQSPTFDLNDPYCKLMAPKYNSLHDPHLRAFYKRKDNLQRLKKSGFVTDKNKVVCSLKEFNDYRQYLTSLKLEFEKHYIQEQKMIEKQVTKLQETPLLPEAADTSKYRDWLLKEERPTVEEQEKVMRNRYLELINEELGKLEQLAEENRRLVLAQDGKKKEGLEKRKQLLLRKKMEEEWRKKEMMLLLKIGNDVKREARLEEQRRKSKEEKLKKKQVILEKKMAYHLKKLQERFLREGFLPPDEIFTTLASVEKPQDIKKTGSLLQVANQELLAKGQDGAKELITSLTDQSGGKDILTQSKVSLQESVLHETNLSKKGSLETESVAESVPQSMDSKVSHLQAKEVFSMTSMDGDHTQPSGFISGGPESISSKVIPSASVECISNEGPASGCGSAGCGSKTSCGGSAGCGSNTCGGPAGCGSKTSCCGSAGCGSKTSCCGSGGCGSKTSCCGPAGCGSKTSCCGSGGCGSKTSCCGSAGCGSKTSCCGSGGCGSKTSCCGSAGCCSNKGCCYNNGKKACCGSGGCGSSGGSGGKANPSYDSSGSSRHGASSGTSKCPLSSTGGGKSSHRSTTKISAKANGSSASSHKTATEGSGKAKQKKREIPVAEPEGQPKERQSNKKRRSEKSKTEHTPLPTQDNEGTESSYSAYVQYLLSNTDQLAIRDSLKGKVSAAELNNIIQNVMTWVVSAVTTILYPALTKFEERVRTRVYTVSEESLLSSDNSSSCSTCNEELCDIYGSLPCASTRKVSFTDTSIKPATSPSDFQTFSGKHTSVLSSNSTSFTKSTHTSQDSDHFKRKFKRGKTAIVMSPSKYSGLLSTTTSVKSSKSDSHISQFQKYSIHPPETANTSFHSKRRHVAPTMLTTKADNGSESERMPFGVGEQKPPKANTNQKGTIKDLRSIFAELKSYLTQMAAILLEDVFKRILENLGFTTSSLSITTEVLLESISESLLGSQPADISPSGSVSRIASFMANDIVENVLDKLQAAAQRTYVDVLSKNDLAAGRKVTCLVPDPAFWRTLILLSYQSMYGDAEEIVEVIIEKLKVFIASSQTKLYQFELCAKIKAIGIPLEQLYAAIPPHTVESEAASLIVKETIRKIVSQTVASSETNIRQYVEEMISNVLSFIQRQTSHEELLPTRESSIILQLINDVFNSLSTEKLKGFALPVKSRAGPEVQGSQLAQEARPTASTTTLYTAERGMKRPFPPVNVPGMVIDAEVEAKGSAEMERNGSAKEQKVPSATQSKATESFHLESRERSSPKSAPQGRGAYQEEGGKVKSTKVEKTESNLDIFVQNAISSSVQGEERVRFPAEEMPSVGQSAKSTSWTLYQAMKKIENEFKEEEQPQLLETVRKLLDDVFQHIWAAWPIWPPAPPPPSLAHLNVQQHPQEEQPASKRQTQFHGQTPFSDSDVSNFTGDLVKTLFQKLSCATLANTQGRCSRQSSLIITDILPLEVIANAGKDLTMVHFKDLEISFEAGTSKGGPQPTAEDLATTKHLEMHSLPSKLSLANDLVETFLVKLETFITSKVESQFCSDIQNLKALANSDVSSNIDQDLRKLLATHYSSLPTNLDDILHSVSKSVLEVKENAKHALPPSYSDLKTYAEEVAKMILQNLKHELDKEVQMTAIPPFIFSESIVASQIIKMVLAVFCPQEYQTELQHQGKQQECILEKLFRKNPGYKKNLQTQIHHTVESILNEVLQTILLDTGDFPQRGHIPESAADTTRKTLSKAAIARCDVSAVSDELVDIILEDLRSALAAGMSSTRALSDRLQPLVFDLVKKLVQPLTHLSSREAKAGLRGHSADYEKGKHPIPGWSKADKVLSRKANLSGYKEYSPEGFAKSLVDNVLLRLASFAEEKLVSELMQVAQWEKQLLTEGRTAPSHSVGLFPAGPSDFHSPMLQGARDDGPSRYHQKAKIMVQDSQTNLKLCAEKLTCTILQLVRKDLEGEMLSSQATVPYKENTSAHEIVNKLLTVLSAQIALTENEIEKRVLKRIFRRHPLGHKMTFPLLARVEEVLNQITQRIMGDLGHLPSLNTDSLFLSSESKSSTYHGVMETASQVRAGSVASEIVDSVLHKMYSVVMDTLFSSSESKSEVDSSSSNKGPLLTDPSCLMESSDLQKMTLALSQLQPPPRSLGEELVQNVLNKIACFAAANLEEILPLSAHHKWKQHMAFLCDIHAGDGTVCRPRTFSEDSDASLMSVSLSKSDLTIYAKDIVSKVLGTIMDEFRTEDYHRTILQVNTLSSDQISLASNLIHSVVQDLHTDDAHLCHLHKHPTLRHFKADGLPSTQMYFHLESAMKDTRTKTKCIFHDEFKAYLKEVLPKEGILRHIFEQQPLTDANIHENLKMLQVAENIVSEVFMRIQDLEPSVCLLKRTPGELSEKLFCYSFKRADTPGLFHSDSQAEIGSVARDIVANVFENVQKCLVHSVPESQEKDIFLGRRDRAFTIGSARIIKHRFTQPEFPFYNISLKASMDTIDRIAKDTVECVVLTLETFVSRHFRREFKCNFLEIVKFPLESLSFAQLTRSLHSLSTETGNGTETFGNEMPGAAGRRTLPTLGSAHNFLDISKLGNAVTKECIEAAFRQVQMLHSELGVYANNAVSSILEIIKRTLDKQLSQKEATLFSSSSESLVLSETISVMLDRCTESLTEITSELMVENLQLEMAGQGFARDKIISQNPVVFPGMKKTSTRYRKIDLSDSCPPINVPGKVIRLEEEEIKEEIPCRLPSVFKYSECDVHTMPERHRGMPCCSSAARARAPRQHGPNKSKGFAEDDWLPRQRSIPKGSILEKLFDKTEDLETVSRVSRQRSKAEPGHCKYFQGSPSFVNRESSCHSPICPAKLAHTAKTIVNTLLSEFGLESEPAGRASSVKKIRPLSSLKEKLPMGTSLSMVFGEPKSKKQTVFSRWEKKMTDSSEKTNTSTEESLLLMQDGSTLLSKWESTQPLSKSPEKHRELELLACTYMPDPCEIQMLADHIVLCVIKELINLTTRDFMEEKDYGIPVPSWKQNLRARSWKSTFPPPGHQLSPCLDLLWEPLTEAVISSILSNISNMKARQEGKDSFESRVAMFCSVDSYCPEHGLRSRSPPLNIDELASQISKVIIGVLVERNILQEPPNPKALSTRKPKYIYVPPLYMADFDDVYHPLVKEVANLLSLEIKKRSKYRTERNTGDFSGQCHSVSRFGRSSRADTRGTMCLSTVDHTCKNQRLSCIASNLDHFIHSLKTEESKEIVNKVLHIIFNSLQPAPSQRGAAGSFSEVGSQNVVPYQDAELSARTLCSSGCPHACRLMNSIVGSNLGLSPKSVLLLDVVSEKLIQSLLEKCLTTDQFTGTYAFDEFLEDEQIYDMRKHESESAVLSHSRQGMQDQEMDSSSSIFTYEIKYSEEPWTEVQSGSSSYESALDNLAQNLVKPLMTDLSLSIEYPRRMNAFSRKSVGFRQPICRKPYGQHGRHSRNEAYCSLSRGRRLESRMPIPERRHIRKNTMQHRTYVSRAATPTGKLYTRKPFSASRTKKSYQREMGRVKSRLEHSPLQPEFSTIYSATFLEEVISQLLIKMYISLRTKYNSVCGNDMQEMNVLFVNALADEFKRAGVGVLQKAEEKVYFPPLDCRTVNKIVESILREFGFQLASEKDKVRDVNSMAKQAAEIVLVEILDYQLPPFLCRKLSKSVCRTIKAESIICRIEECFSFPKAQRQKQPPPAYITILSQKYLERVINQIMAHFFLPCDSTAQEEDHRETSQPDFDDLCAYMVDQVMRSIAKHKIWVAKKDDRCHLHSQKEIQSMVDSVYTKILGKSGSQSSVQKEVTCRSTNLVDSIASFIIQEVTHHHLQTFLSADEEPCMSHDMDALSKNIVKTVLDSVSKPSASPPGVFPAKQLEEIVTRVLSKIFRGSTGKKKVIKGWLEADLCGIAKRLANSISLQFGRAAVMGAKKGEEQSLGAPLMDVMDDVVDSVCHNISREQERVPHGLLGPPKDDTAFENIKSCIEKGISDYLLHPLFSGDFHKDSLPSLVYNTKDTEDEFGEIQEERESRSPFNTFLSSGFLKDIITGLLSKIFPSATSRHSTPLHDETHPSDSDMRKLSTQLLNDVRVKLLKHKIRVTKDAHPERNEFSEEDVQNMADSLCGKILQNSGSLEAVQRDVKNKSHLLIDRIAGFLVGDILKQHVQPFISRQASPAWDAATPGDSTNRFDIYRTFIKPLDLKQAAKEMRDGTTSSLFREIVSGLFSKIADTLSDIPLADSEEELGDTAVRLAKSITQKLTKSRLNTQEDPEEQLGCSSDIRTLVDRMPLYKGPSDEEDSSRTLPDHSATLSFQEDAEQQLYSGRPSNLAEVKCFIQKNLFVGEVDSRAKAPAPYRTVLSCQVLEAIIDRLLGLIFPLSSSTSAGSAQEEGSFGPDFYKRIAQFKKDIIATVLVQSVWISTYGNDRETRVSEEAMKSMVESVYCDLLHEVLFQQPLPKDRESLSNFYVTKIACFVMNEMFKYHLQSLAAEEASPCLGYHLTVFPYSLLEVMLSQLLEKIFSSPENTGKQIDFLDSNFTEMASDLKSCVITELSAHEIRLKDIPERIPDMDQETEEDIANSIYNQILHNSESQRELRNSLLSQENGVILRVASVLVREILNYHLCPFLSGNDASKISCIKRQAETEPRPCDIYSATFLEDIIVAFFCQILSSPNIQSYSKDAHLSEEKLRERITEQVNALVLAFQFSSIKVIHCAEGCSYFPQVTAEKVIQISNAMYQKLIGKFGSELEIFRALQKKSHSLAEQLTPLMLQEISGYHFQPLLTGDTSPYLFSFLQADTIIDRVETLLPDSTYSSSSFGEKFLKIIHRIFPLWPSGGSDDPEEHEPTVDRLEKRTYFTKHRKEDPISKPLPAEDGAGVHSSAFLKDIFRGLISKLLSSSTNVCMPDREENDPESLLKHLVESIFKEFAKSPIKVLPMSKGQASPAVSETEMGNVTHLRNKFQGWQRDDKAEDSDSADGQALGEMVDSVCAGIMRNSSSDGSLYDDLTSQNEEAVDRLACYMVRAVSRGGLEQSSESEDDSPYSTTVIKLESDKIIQKFLSDMELVKHKPESSESLVPAVSVLFLEEILSRFVTKILLAPTNVASTLSKAEVNEIVDQLKKSVEMQMSKNKINLVAEEQPNLHPEYEETVNQVVHSVFSNVLEKSGSQERLYNDMRSTKVIFPEKVASIIVDEISSYSINNPFDENSENETRSALELDRIVSKVVAQMSHHLGPEKESSTDIMTALPDTTTALPDMAQETSLEEILIKSEELPVKIVPCLGKKTLNIDPHIISDHLAVLSIKTESLEKLNRTCLSRTGVSLNELRKASMSSRSVVKHIDQQNENRKKERRPSLDFSGHLDVKPREIACRNSFQSLMKPDISRVELLKDVTSKEDLMVRLIAHDVEDDGLSKHDLEAGDSGDEEEEEKVLQEESSFFFEAPIIPPGQDEGAAPTKAAQEPVLTKIPSGISRKKSLYLSKCCPPLSMSSSITDADLRRKSTFPPVNLPQIEITSMTSGLSMSLKNDRLESDTVWKEAVLDSTPEPEICTSTTDVPSKIDEPPASSTEEEPEEEKLEKALVDMHLSRDTEETSGAFEITSVYQVHDINESLSEGEEEEADHTDTGTNPMTSSSSEAATLPRQQSSRFEKISIALSRVFSRTSTSNLNNPEPAKEKPDADKA
ncbi:fibrous sheath-interacting protein 2 isoform X2 [Paroedura picta]|uniref:fibrous sheath-interacting protein 2 isoform X2 n=1 Tax=Paroedura picta TaxID=143630 RepID=UPI0040560448